MPDGAPRIVVVGLGPAGGEYLSEQTATAMASARRAFVRTARHPAVHALGPVESFDGYYDRARRFEDVYADIVEALVAAATAQVPEPVVYAVPGSPLVAERTVDLLRGDPRVEVEVMPALSFLDLAWARLGVDPVAAGVHLVDAEQFATQAAGEPGPFLVAQCWSVELLSDIKLSARVDESAPPPEVVVLHHLGLPDEDVRRVGWWDLDRTLSPDHLTSLYVPSLVGQVEAELARLEELVRTLRAQCPWDRVQTHATLMPHLVEESYEVLDALAALDAPGAGGHGAAAGHLREELGDLLFQIVFHARLAEEEGSFTLAEVARGIHDKLVSRHPHVFGDGAAESAEAVVRNWEAIKKEEKGRSSVTEGIPSHLPALLLSTKLQRKAAAVGLTPEVDDAREAIERVERLAGAQPTDEPPPDAVLDADAAASERDVGEILFAVAALARRCGVDPEQALRARAMRLRDEIRATEGARLGP